MQKKITQFLIAICLAINLTYAQGSDIVFLIDNSNTIDSQEFDGMVTTIHSIIENVIYCPSNTVSVVHYGTPPQNANNPNLSELFIEYDFTNDIDTALSSINQQLPGADSLHEAIYHLGDALDNIPNVAITSPLTQLSPTSTNNLVVFIFTDAFRATGDSFLVNSANTGINDPLAFEAFTSFKNSPRNATFFVVHIPPNSDNNASPAGAAIASSGGNYGTENEDIENYLGDPDAGNLRYYYLTNTFFLSETEINAISYDLCSVSTQDPCDIIFPEITVAPTEDDCSATFTGSNNGNHCSNQVYSWTVYLDADPTPVFQVSSQTSIDENDWQFSENPGTYTVELTITTPNFTTQPVTEIFTVAEECLPEPCPKLGENGNDQVQVAFCANDNTNYDLLNHLDSLGIINGVTTGGTWNAGNGFFNPFLDPNPGTLTYYFGDCSFRLFITIKNCIVECEDYDDITLSNPNNNITGSTTVNYEDYANISASNIISPNATSVYEASESITLIEDFHAQSGSNFIARIRPCDSLLVPQNPARPIVDNNKVVINSQLSIYPNPTKSIFYIEHSYLKILSYVMYDIQGRKVKYQNTINNTSHIINVASLEKGIYILNITLEDSTMITKQLIIE